MWHAGRVRTEICHILPNERTLRMFKEQRIVLGVDMVRPHLILSAAHPLLRPLPSRLMTAVPGRAQGGACDARLTRQSHPQLAMEWMAALCALDLRNLLLVCLRRSR